MKSILSLRRSGRSAALSKADRKQAGYSLLEILIVLAIIALIATLVGPRLLGQLDRSKVTAARVQSRAIVSALETMRLDIGRYPTTEEGLVALMTAPTGAEATWAGPYLDQAAPADPWGNPYVYAPPSTPESRPRVGSLGADGKEGGDGAAKDIFSDDQ